MDSAGALTLGVLNRHQLNQKDILKKVLDNIDYFSTICNLIQKDYINVKLKAYRSFQKHEINRAIRAIAQIPGAIILKNEEKKKIVTYFFVSTWEFIVLESSSCKCVFVLQIEIIILCLHTFSKIYLEIDKRKT